MLADRIEIPQDIRQQLLDSSKLPSKVKLGDRDYFPLDAVAAGFKAVVWRVRDVRGRDRAVKLATYEDYLDRSWAGEIEHAAPLERYPVFARIEDAGRTTIDLGEGITFDAVYFVEEWVEGCTLRDFLDRRGEEVTATFLLGYVRQATRALEALQAHALEHDDFHTGNVMLADPAPGDDDRLQVRVIDMGSVKPRDRTVKPIHDLDHFAEHLVTIYNAVIRGRHVPRVERRFLVHVREALDRIFEPDHTVALRDPRAIRAAFELAESRAAYDSDRGGQPMSSPFEFISSEHISDDHIFVKIFAETPWLSKVASRDPCLVTGPRGCGKSTLLRWLSLRTQLARDTPDLDRFPIAGFYVSCSSELEGRFSWLSDSETATLWEAEIVHYFNLVLAAEMLSTLAVMREQQEQIERWHIGMREEEKILAFLRDALQSDTTALGGASRLRLALSVVERERYCCDIAMRRGEHLKRTTGETFTGDFTGLLVTLIPFFSTHRIGFLIDDFTRRRVPEHVQRVLNKVIWPRRAHHVFKVSSEKDGAVLTDTAGRVLEAARELVTVDVGQEYLSLAEGEELRRARAFAVELLNNRLQTAKWEATAEQLLGHSEWEQGTLARALRETADRSQYHGLECIADLCSGDIATLLLVFRRIFESHKVTHTSTTRIPNGVQHRAIRQASGEQVEWLRDHFPCGPGIRTLVNEFGTYVGDMARHGRLINQSGTDVPPCCPRIEVDDPSQVGETLVGSTRQLFDELVRRAVFIDMEPGRSRRNHVQTLRWQLRRVYLPSFGAALTKNTALKLHPAEFKLLLEDPKTALARFRRVANLDDKPQPQSLFEDERL